MIIIEIDKAIEMRNKGNLDKSDHVLLRSIDKKIYHTYVLIRTIVSNNSCRGWTVANVREHINYDYLLTAGKINKEEADKILDYVDQYFKIVR